MQEAAPDQLPVNLVRAFPDLSDLGVAHQALDAEVLAVAVPPEQLNGIGRGSHGAASSRCVKRLLNDLAEVA